MQETIAPMALAPAPAGDPEESLLDGEGWGKKGAELEWKGAAETAGKAYENLYLWQYLPFLQRGTSVPTDSVSGLLVVDC
jgi:hypothetical protein